MFQPCGMSELPSCHPWHQVEQGAAFLDLGFQV
jgi:hypothetical protein